MEAFETTGTVDEQNRLILDQPLPFADSSRVRVIVLRETDVNKQTAAEVPKQGKIDSFEEVADQLGDVLDASAPSPRPALSDFAVSRAGIYRDHT